MRVRHVTFTFDGVSANGQRARNIAIQALRFLSKGGDRSHRAVRSARVDVTAGLNVEPDVRIAERTALAISRRLGRGGE